MRKLSLGLLAAAAALLPTLPASAQSWYSTSLYNPYYSSYSYPTSSYYGYSYTSPYVYGTRSFSAVVNPYADLAAKNALVNRVNAAIQAGQLTVQEGNAILIRGVW
jgi:hypothetical protein